MRLFRRSSWPLKSLLFGLFIAALPLTAELTETFALKEGWNAIYPTVTLENPSPDVVFAGLPTGSSVYAYFAVEDPSQFVFDAANPTWRGESWRRWSNAFPDNELNDLGGVAPQVPLLIQVPEDATLALTGIPVATIRGNGIYTWELRGLSATDSTVTFAEFFSHTEAPRAVCELYEGRWRLIPLDSTIDPGRAYWLYIEDGTSFEGRISFRNLSRNGLRLGTGYTTLDYSSLDVDTGLILEFISGDLSLEFGDGFFVNAFSTVEAVHPLESATAPQVMRLQLRVPPGTKPSEKSALLRLSDADRISSRYVHITH